MEEKLVFFKALADVERIQIAGLLARRPLTVEQLAGELGLAQGVVSRHLGRLEEAGLVSAQDEAGSRAYRFERQALEAMRQRVLARSERLDAIEAGLEAFDRQVVKNYMGSDGRLQGIPSQKKKLKAILRYLELQFEPDVLYNEAEVNAVLARFHDDTASLRRSLVEYGQLLRTDDGQGYWRVGG